MVLPTNRQIQIIADSLSNPAAAPPIDGSMLTGPWRGFYTWIQDWIAKDADDVEPARLRSDFVSSHGKYGQNPIAHFADHYSLIEQANRTP